MLETNDLINKVYNYIINQYGENSLNIVQSDTHKSMVIKFIDIAKRENHDIERVSNKIIAMLRINP